MRKVSIACKEMTFSVPFEKKNNFFSPSFASKLFNSTELYVKWSPVQLHTASSSVSLCKCDNQNKLILKINWFTVTSNRLDSSISQQLNIFFFLCLCSKKNFFYVFFSFVQWNFSCMISRQRIWPNIPTRNVTRDSDVSHNVCPETKLWICFPEVSNYFSKINFSKIWVLT